MYLCFSYEKNANTGYVCIFFLISDAVNLLLLFQNATDKKHLTHTAQPSTNLAQSSVASEKLLLERSIKHTSLTERK